MRETEQLFTDSTLYVTRQGATVRKDGGRVAVTGPDGERIADYPVTEITGVNVFGGVEVTTPALALAGDHDFHIGFFSVNGVYRGRYDPASATLGAVVRAQATLSDDRALALASEFVRGKIQNAATLLTRKNVSPAPLRRNLDTRVDGATTPEELRGIEGEATRAYLDRFSETLLSGWEFDRRTRNPPEDEVNALLSLVYTLTTQEAETALRRVNLNPHLGVYHTDRPGTPSLALDLVEEFRPAFADAFATRLLNRGTLDEADFTGDPRLTDEAFRLVLEKYEAYLQETRQHPDTGQQHSRREIIREQARRLRRTITGESDRYRPFKLV